MSEFAIRVENLSKRRIGNWEFRNPQSAIRNPTNAVLTHKGSYYYHSYHETYGDGSGKRKHRRRRLFGRRRKAD